MSLPQYQYRPLLPRQIRVLSLSPGARDGALTGELEVVNLDDVNGAGNQDTASQTHAFEALSYVWGIDIKSHVLEVSGTSIAITASLNSALTRIRYSDRPRIVWADAVCINQGDISEKEEQIPLMGQIFSSATRVIADLGEASADSDAALDLIDRCWRADICSGLDATAYGRSLSRLEITKFLFLAPDAIDDAWADLEQPPPEAEEWNMVGEFLQRPWFSRLWIVQEFVLARDVVFICGTRQIDWRHFLAFSVDSNNESTWVVTWALAGRNTEYMRDMEAVNRMCHHRALRLLQATSDGRELLASLDLPRYKQWRSPSWVDLLAGYGDFKCTIARDRYFALLGVAADDHMAEHPQLKADYTTPDTEWARAMGKFILQLPDGPKAFMRSGLATMQDNFELPSWMQTFDPASSRPVLELCELVEVSSAAWDGSSFWVKSVPASPGDIVVRGYKIDKILHRPPPSDLREANHHETVVDAAWAYMFRHADRALGFFLKYLDDTSQQGFVSALAWSSLEAMVRALVTNQDPSMATFTLPADVRTLVLGCLFMLVGMDLPSQVAQRVKPWLLETLETEYGYLAADIRDRLVIGFDRGNEAVPDEERDSSSGTSAEPASNYDGPTTYSGGLAADEDSASKQSTSTSSRLLFEVLQAKALQSAGSHIGLAAYLALDPAVTTQGIFCTVPRCAEVDDEVWIISGCRLPVLLRRSRERDGVYRLVGTCYADGIMNGEATMRDDFAWQDVLLY
ncbi:heterokaryon incompatibility protein-domain-containing protein [Microdochium trichocladiopsis]|uniref:Heterokaryon incompatibility protein-domain-containing protein n=1 Tax=Microdochium trichocladiopsis TaxID=1682393 RepID=A0A9P9BIA9_9PEZI|nr:heterokaryon incompatibility protein-domain-containing protein [Microdochium trichocladiopsis]KAH7014175.1 heterokaryon incompatibility protein-domain-containing protein [Microdochium trichocladiopsis]